MTKKSPDKNVEAVRELMLRRSEVGLKKYGVTTDRKDLSLTDWLRHMQLELADGTVYAEKAIKMCTAREANLRKLARRWSKLCIMRPAARELLRLLNSKD